MLNIGCKGLTDAADHPIAAFAALFEHGVIGIVNDVGVVTTAANHVV